MTVETDLLKESGSLRGCEATYRFRSLSRGPRRFQRICQEAQACPLAKKDKQGQAAGLTRDDMLDVLEEYLDRIVALEALVAQLATGEFKILRSAHAGGGEGDQVWEEVSVAALLPPGMPRAGAAPAEDTTVVL